jgi:tetratricopeptide (TPR) repeat protein
MLVLALCSNAPAQKSPVPVLEQAPPLSPAASPSERIRFSSADEALAAGLTNLASGIYSSLAEQTRDSALRERAQLGLATCLLEQNDAAGAVKILENLPVSPSRQIRLVIARAILGKPEPDVGNSLKTLTPVSLTTADLPWYHVARGLLALVSDKPGDSKNLQTSQAEFARAAALCDSSANYHQAHHVRMLGYLARVRVGTIPGEETISQLREHLALHENRSLGFQYAKLLAIALALQDRNAEAVNVLRQRNFVLATERAEAFLLIGFIFGTDKREAREALYSVLDAKTPPNLQLLALDRLASTATATTAVEIYDNLTSLANRATNPLVTDALHYARARIMFAVGDLSRAERAANDLLERTPQSTLRADALRILAAAAWKNGFLARAADHLTQLQKHTTGRIHAHIALVTADCLLLAARQTPVAAPAAATAAANAYAAVLPLLETPAERGNALFLRVYCHLLAADVRTATDVLNSPTITATTDTASILRSEWTLIEWLRTNNHVAATLARIDSLFKRYPNIDPAFRVRFLWQRALVALSTGDTVRAAALATQITAIMDNAPPPSLNAQRDAILGKVSLLKARALIAANPSATRETFNELRAKFSDKEAAVSSYLVEGRLLAARGEREQARKAFTAAHELCANDTATPFSDYAAEALYQAAQQDAALARISTSQTTISRAAIALEKFAVAHPSHKLANSAKLQQAELFRLSGNFDDALIVYDRLVASLPDSPEKWRAEMGRADCLYAKALSGVTRTDDATDTVNISLDLAIDAYSRLFQPVPVRHPDLKAEAGCKWGNALASRLPTPPPTGRSASDIAREADQVRWQVVCELLKNKDTAASLGPSGRFWAMRTLLFLAASTNDRGATDEVVKIYALLLDYNRDTQGKPQHRLPHENFVRNELARILRSSATPNATPSQP